MATNPTETEAATAGPELTVEISGLLPPLPRAFLEGRDLDLLEPLKWAAPGGELSLEPSPDPSHPDRKPLAEALATANASYGHPAARELADKLASSETAVVVAGQQPGLLGGPLYTLSKAVAAVRWAECLEEMGRPAVAVFWTANEDHDYREVAHTALPSPSDPEGLLRLELEADPRPLMPVGTRSLGASVEAVLTAMKAQASGDRSVAWVDRLAGWYRPNARFGEAFSRLLVAILGKRSPLFLDALLPALKQAERPWLAEIVRLRDELDTAFATKDREIERRGYDLQVQPQPGASPLFYLHGLERRRLVFSGESVGIRGAESFSEPIGWLDAVIEENAAVVSPGVLARPAIQDAVLGTTLQIMGPGEVSYLPQAAPVYELLGITPPYVALRPQAMVLGRHQIEKLEATGLALDDLVAPELDLDRVLAGGGGTELVGKARAAIAQALDALNSEAQTLDSNLETSFEKTKGQIERALAAFAAKIDKAIAQKDEVTRSRALALRQACRPGGVLQERVVSSAYFPGKYGPEFADAYFDQLDLDPRRLSVIIP